MRMASLFLVSMIMTAAGAVGAPRIDNVLVRMVPSNATSLIGARMDLIRKTDLFRKLVDAQKLPQIDEFSKGTGFDPRRDVRELLFANTPAGGVVMARGTFQVRRQPLKEAKLVRHGEYNIWSANGVGYCILDATLAAAGDMVSVEAALDEWKSRGNTGAAALLARANPVDPQSQFWGVSSGFAGFLANHMPKLASGIDFSKIFRGLEDTWFETSFTGNLKGQIHGTTATDQDAMNLRDTAKGLIGFGRLSVPENQPEMLKLWDGFTVEQEGRSVTIRADIPPDQLDRLVQLLGAAQGSPGSGRGLRAPLGGAPQ
jgi:hypothetical protein